MTDTLIHQDPRTGTCYYTGDEVLVRTHKGADHQNATILQAATTETGAPAALVALENGANETVWIGHIRHGRIETTTQYRITGITPDGDTVPMITGQEPTDDDVQQIIAAHGFRRWINDEWVDLDTVTAEVYRRTYDSMGRSSYPELLSTTTVYDRMDITGDITDEADEQARAEYDAEQEQAQEQATAAVPAKLDRFLEETRVFKTRCLQRVRTGNRVHITGTVQDMVFVRYMLECYAVTLDHGFYRVRDTYGYNAAKLRSVAARFPAPAEQ